MPCPADRVGNGIVVLVTLGEDPVLPGLIQALEEEFSWHVVIPEPPGPLVFLRPRENNVIVIRSKLPRFLPSPILRFLRYVEFLGKAVVRCVRLARRSVGKPVFWAIDLPAGPVCYLASRVCGGTFVLDYRELYCETTYVRFRRFWRFVERFLIRRSAKVVTRSDGRARHLQRSLRLRQVPYVLYNIPQLPPDGEVLSSGPPHAPPWRVIYHGGMSEERGIHTLVRAFALLPADFILLLYGWCTPRYESLLRSVIDELRLGSRVKLGGALPRETLARVTARCHVGVIAYRALSLNNYHCAPTKLFEYLHAGIPVVVPAFPDMLEMIGRFGFGVAADPESPESIATAILSVTSQYSRLRGNVLRAKKLMNWAVQGAALRSFVRSMECGGN